MALDLYDATGNDADLADYLPSLAGMIALDGKQYPEWSSGFPNQGCACACAHVPPTTSSNAESRVALVQGIHTEISPQIRISAQIRGKHETAAQRTVVSTGGRKLGVHKTAIAPAMASWQTIMHMCFECV